MAVGAGVVDDEQCGHCVGGAGDGEFVSVAVVEEPADDVAEIDDVDDGEDVAVTLLDGVCVGVAGADGV